MSKRHHLAEHSLLDTRHPLIRRLVRAVQLRDREVIADVDSRVELGASADNARHAASLTQLAHVGELLLEVGSHIRRSVPRPEHDEAAQLLLTADDGAPIGRLRRPALMPDLLHPVLEVAIESHLTGPEEGDSDADSEREPLHEEMAVRS